MLCAAESFTSRSQCLCCVLQKALLQDHNACGVCCRKLYFKITMLTMQVAIVRPILMFFAAVLWTNNSYIPGDVSTCLSRWHLGIDHRQPIRAKGLDVRYRLHLGTDHQQPMRVELLDICMCTIVHCTGYRLYLDTDLRQPIRDKRLNV